MGDLREAINNAYSKALAAVSHVGTANYAEREREARQWVRDAFAGIDAALSAEPAQEMTDERLDQLAQNEARDATIALIFSEPGRMTPPQFRAAVRALMRAAIAADRASRLPEMGEGDLPAPSGYLITEFGNQRSLSFDKPTPTVRDEVTGMTCEPLYTRAAVKALVRGKT